MVEKTNDLDGVPACTLTDLVHEWPSNSVLLKVDIEGSEKEVFEHLESSVLDKVGLLFIELHDRMKPGCGKAVMQALTNMDFEISTADEYLVAYKRGLS